MRRLRFVVPFGALLCGLALVAPSLARAEPSIWDRARHPGARSEARLLAALERMADAREQASDDAELSQRLARAAVAMVDLARLPAPADPRLAVAIATALVGADVGRTAEAERLLQMAVLALPPSSLLAHAWHELGIVRSLRFDHAGARDADTRVIELAWAGEQRATAFYNRAESAAHLGDLRQAERDYRSAAAEPRPPEIQALARLGLGVVLERQGDLPAAYAAIEQGLALRLPLSLYMTDDPLELPGVFFSPPYERFYLRGLIELTRARGTEDPLEQRAAYERAVSQWDSYLLAAARDEPWRANAERHRARAAAELRKLPPRHRRSH
jgi:tetratricopeptide (TPR) repeat protein